jgi:hypothetical protein
MTETFERNTLVMDITVFQSVIMKGNRIVKKNPRYGFIVDVLVPNMEYLVFLHTKDGGYVITKKKKSALKIPTEADIDLYIYD